MAHAYFSFDCVDCVDCVDSFDSVDTQTEHSSDASPVFFQPSLHSRTVRPHCSQSNCGQHVGGQCLTGVVSQQQRSSDMLTTVWYPVLR